MTWLWVTVAIWLLLAGLWLLLLMLWRLVLGAAVVLLWVIRGVVTLLSGWPEGGSGERRGEAGQDG
jgi:hypothetical protein